MKVFKGLAFYTFRFLAPICVGRICLAIVCVAGVFSVSALSAKTHLRPDIPVNICPPVSSATAKDYNFKVLPIKIGEWVADSVQTHPLQEYPNAQPLDLSVYKNQIILLSLFSPNCPLCISDVQNYYAFAKEHWPKGQVKLLLLTYGYSSDNSEGKNDYFAYSPERILHYVKVDHKKRTKPGRRVDLTPVDIYHIVVDKPVLNEPPGQGSALADDTKDNFAISAIFNFLSTDGQSELFPNGRGVPYRVILDQQGYVVFQGHFKASHNYSFITDLVKGSCATQLSQ